MVDPEAAPREACKLADIKRWRYLPKFITGFLLDPIPAKTPIRRPGSNRWQGFMLWWIPYAIAPPFRSVSRETFRWVALALAVAGVAVVFFFFAFNTSLA